VSSVRNAPMRRPLRVPIVGIREGRDIERLLWGWIG
jgi:hypothetical protein